MKVVVFPNLMKKDAYRCTLGVCSILSGLGAQIGMDLRYRENFYSMDFIKFAPFHELAKNADIAIAIGGDGTILKCAAKLSDSKAELLGINTGHLGFMASVEKDNLGLLKSLFTGDYKISERMLLKADFEIDRKVESFHALNDIVVTGTYAKIIDFDIYINENLSGNYRADGVVFATPTGSTAYSLSAGGPIIEPELQCIEMNLICPHSLFTRPMIYTADKVIKFVHNSDEDTNICFSVDGNKPMRIESGKKLIITKSERKVRLIDMTGVTFHDALNHKLMRSLK